MRSTPNCCAGHAQRIQNLGFFDKVDLATKPGSSPDKTVIETTVSEKSTGELSFGAGYATSEGPLGDVRLSERNLLGTGRSVSANFTISPRRQALNLSYTEPYFLGYDDVTAGVDAFLSSTSYESEASYDQKTSGGTLRASYPLTEHWTPRSAFHGPRRPRSTTSRTAPRSSSRTRKALT